MAIFLMPRLTFKALDVDTLIPTPQGFRCMGELQVGDEVLDEQGKPTKIIGVSPIYLNRPCYKVTFSTGEQIVADEDHLWLTSTRKDRENKRRECPTVKTTKVIAETLKCRKENNHRVQVCKAVDGQTQELLVPPYTLGAWLGDGTTGKAEITSADAEVMQYIRDEGVPVREAFSEHDPYKYVLNGGPGHKDYWQTTSIQARMRTLGVLNVKHIPEHYLIADKWQRLALLQGLMDSDGSCSKREGNCIFSNTNLILTQQVRKLAASLGFKPSAITQHRGVLNGKDCSMVYVFQFRAYEKGFSPFRLSRKAGLLPTLKGHPHKYRQIVSVEKVDSRPVKCISVDSASHLYLAGEGYIPTHNTSLISAWCQFAICLDQDVRIVLCRATTSDAEATLYGIKTNISGNPVMKETFSDILQFEKWTDEMITLANRKPGMREPTIDTTGLNSSKTGSHPDAVLIDDIVHENNYQSGVEMEKAKNKIQAFYPIVERWGTLMVLGTRWSELDCYGWVLDFDERRVQANKKPRWEKIIWSCWKEDDQGNELVGVPRFPSVLPIQRIDDLRENTDPKMFAAWYLNKARTAGEDIFTLAYIQPFDCEFVGGPYSYIDLPPTETNIHLRRKFGNRIQVATVMLVDPAPTVGPKSDFTGIAVVGFDKEANWWVPAAYEVKMLPRERLNFLIYLALLYTPQIIALENADMDGVLLQDELSAKGLQTTVVSFNPRLDRQRITSDAKLAPRGFTKKEAQIERLEPKLRAGRCYFATGETSALTRQLTKYPQLVHDDVLDAFSMAQAYESALIEKVDMDPMRVFAEIEAREFALEGMNPDGSPMYENDKVPRGTSFANAGLLTHRRAINNQTQLLKGA
jgi:LAGLIDADG DNA endonuclease family protein